ncbi:DUF1697 domain-containing protein [Muriicola sp. E247]|uniref:DUF1697 domain-containing protein n=1 Tax=Muriicola sp. E247 TaxID=3242730 RepID=UPI0035255546
METFVALLRGINVGGHHKVPMAELRTEFEKMGYSKVITLLNSGNIIFKAASEDEYKLQDEIFSNISKAFGFEIPTTVIKAKQILNLTADNPFSNESLHNNIRFYATFLNNSSKSQIPLPWQSEDGAYRIIYHQGRIICSVLDLSVSKTPEAMGILQSFYGKKITTRNWNTVVRVENKLASLK